MISSPPVWNGCLGADVRLVEAGFVLSSLNMSPVLEMRTEKSLLLADALINLALGVLLIFFPSGLAAVLGIPSAESAFYSSILGAVLFGIGVALLIERNRGGGLGLAGAVAINLSGGVVLCLWLLFGDLNLTLGGRFILWGLVALLVGISVVEVLASRSKQNG